MECLKVQFVNDPERGAINLSNSCKEGSPPVLLMNQNCMYISDPHVSKKFGDVGYFDWFDDSGTHHSFNLKDVIYEWLARIKELEQNLAMAIEEKAAAHYELAHKEDAIRHLKNHIKQNDSPNYTDLIDIWVRKNIDKLSIADILSLIRAGCYVSKVVQDPANNGE